MSNNKIWIVAGIVALTGWLSAKAVEEYRDIKAKVQATQARIDKLADETNETIKSLNATIQDLRDVFKRFKAEQETQEIYQPPLPEELPPPKEEPKPVKPTIIMHSGADCGPCNDWKAKEMQKWVKAGWDVQVVVEVDSKRSWPWFEITDSEGRFEVDGPLTNEKFLEAKKGAKK